MKSAQSGSKQLNPKHWSSCMDNWTSMCCIFNVEVFALNYLKVFHNSLVFLFSLPSVAYKKCGVISFVGLYTWNKRTMSKSWIVTFVLACPFSEALICPWGWSLLNAALHTYQSCLLHCWGRNPGGHSPTLLHKECILFNWIAAYSMEYYYWACSSSINIV